LREDRSTLFKKGLTNYARRGMGGRHFELARLLGRRVWGISGSRISALKEKTERIERMNPAFERKKDRAKKRFALSIIELENWEAKSKS